MLIPEGVAIDGVTGAVNPQTGRYERRLSELRGLYQDRAETERHISARGDPIVYEVAEYRKDGSDLCFGTTVMAPGKVGNEYYMTRGHFHRRRDMGEVYATTNGRGLLLLQSRSGETRTVEMRPGISAFIPPDWAHRSVNVGAEKLVFIWMCNPNAGHDYAEILENGMRKIVVDRAGVAAIVDNPLHTLARP
jgi:glucose-6-phosphate isomerase, archaeal